MTKDFIQDFIEKDAIDAVNTLVHSNNVTELAKAVPIIAELFGADKNTFSLPKTHEETKFINSFHDNLSLLVQKTWVEKSDSDLKEQVLYQLKEFCSSLNQKTWKESYIPFHTILDTAVYLMFGGQAKTEEFIEYAFRIDPEFGIFWWYIQSLPQEPAWSEEQYRLVLLLGMYFLANY
ncbi:MAG: hypothetical protein K6E51_01835 [Treponema sp.]|nr:hypothetical protein [Treponema sp.]